MSDTDALPQLSAAFAFRRKWLSDPVEMAAHAKTDTSTPSSSPVLPENLSARSGLSTLQIVLLIVAICGFGFWLARHPASLGLTLYWVLWFGFMMAAGLRLVCSLIIPVANVRTAFDHSHDTDLPAYSVIVALYREEAMAAQLVQAMNALDYPQDRLEVLFALEADDTATCSALMAQNLPAHMRIVIVPKGGPRTKPNALNHALTHTKGAHVVIYDAEDIPHPQQLREAVHRFKQGHEKLACLQAPLRPLAGTGFIARQFAAEYAVQFDIVLPAFCALNLPLPLGGTSNHFRADVLKDIGGWDAWNVTEDADLGMRLGRLGYRSAMLTRPTFETPPTDIETWIPQRTRWIKGYLQTLIVHTRDLWPLKPHLWLSLALGVGLSALSSMAYAPFMLLVIARVMLSAFGQSPLYMAGFDLALLLTGLVGGALALNEGAKRSLTPFDLRDMLMAPLYWCLTSLAAIYAVSQLLTRPYYWNKTQHEPLQTPLENRAMVTV